MLHEILKTDKKNTRRNSYFNEKTANDSCHTEKAVNVNIRLHFHSSLPVKLQYIYSVRHCVGLPGHCYVVTRVFCVIINVRAFLLAKLCLITQTVIQQIVGL